MPAENVSASRWDARGRSRPAPLDRACRCRSHAAVAIENRVVNLMQAVAHEPAMSTRPVPSAPSTRNAVAPPPSATHDDGHLRRRPIADAGAVASDPDIRQTRPSTGKPDPSIVMRPSMRGQGERL